MRQKVPEKKIVLVSNGMASPEVIAALLPYTDAENIDLQKNTLLLPTRFHFLVDNTDALMQKYAGRFIPNYPSQRISAFLVMGVYAYIRLNHDRSDDNEVREQVHGLLLNLLDSGLFTHV